MLALEDEASTLREENKSLNTLVAALKEEMNSKEKQKQKPERNQTDGVRIKDMSGGDSDCARGKGKQAQ